MKKLTLFAVIFVAVIFGSLALIRMADAGIEIIPTGGLKNLEKINIYGNNYNTMEHAMLQEALNNSWENFKKETMVKVSALFNKKNSEANIESIEKITLESIENVDKAKLVKAVTLAAEISGATSESIEKITLESIENVDKAKLVKLMNLVADISAFFNKESPETSTESIKFINIYDVMEDVAELVIEITPLFRELFEQEEVEF